MRTKTFALTLATAAGLAGSAAAGTDVALWLTVLHNNDGESQIIDAGEGLEDFGGVARFATLVGDLRAQALVSPALPLSAAHGSLLISAGDNFLAGPEFNASLSNGAPFFDTLAMELIGYDAAAIGNHEFDFGPDTLRDFLDGFDSGNPLFFLSANLDFSAEAALSPLVGTRLAASTVISVAGFDIGIVGATTPNLPFISSPRDVIVNAVAPAVQAEVDALTLAGVDIIIMTSHLQSINEEIALITMLDGVDVSIAGGGDELLANAGDLLVPGDAADRPYPEFSTDLDGTSVPVVAGPGDYTYVGRLICGFDAGGSLVEIDLGSGPVRVAGGANPDAVAADPVVQAMVVDPVEAALADQAANIIATSEVPLDGTRPNIRVAETNLGNLCADSLLWQARENAAAFGIKPADVAIQNGGGIRNSSVIPAGALSELEAFGVLPFANFAAVAEDLPVPQFKEILENAVSRVEFVDGRWAHIAGCRISYNPNGTAQTLDENSNVLTPGDRVREVVLSDGRVLVQNGAVVDPAGTVTVSSIDFLFGGGDQYPYRGHPFTRIGETYFLAFQNYLTGPLGGVVSGSQYPEGGEGRINDTKIGTRPLTACNPADVAEPTGLIDLADVTAFVQGFELGQPLADLAAPFELNDLADVVAFVSAFVGGCD